MANPTAPARASHTVKTRVVRVHATRTVGARNAEEEYNEEAAEEEDEGGEAEGGPNRKGRRSDLRPAVRERNRSAGVL